MAWRGYFWTQPCGAVCLELIRSADCHRYRKRRSAACTNQIVPRSLVSYNASFKLPTRPKTITVHAARAAVSERSPC